MQQFALLEEEKAVLLHSEKRSSAMVCHFSFICLWQIKDLTRQLRMDMKGPDLFICLIPVMHRLYHTPIMLLIITP